MAKKKTVKKTAVRKVTNDDVLVVFQGDIIRLHKRIDRIVDAISKSKNVKGL